MTPSLPPDQDSTPREWRRIAAVAAGVVLLVTLSASWVPGAGLLGSVLPTLPGADLVYGGLTLLARCAVAGLAALLVWSGVDQPWPALGVAMVLGLAVPVLDRTLPFAVFAVLGGIVVVAVWRRPAASLAAGAAGVLLGWGWMLFPVPMPAPLGGYVYLAYTQPFVVGALYTFGFLLLAAAAFGLRVLVSRETDRLGLLARSQQVEEQAGVVGERARLAHDLHDVVAHHVSLIAVRAETAPYTHPDLQPQARTLLAEIAADARLALDELRGVLGILGRSGGGERAPQPSWADLPDLVRRSGIGGTEVVLRGDVDAVVPPAVGYAAYRVVQESLTNARRHAPGSPVDVLLEAGPALVTVTVRSMWRPGDTRPLPTAPGALDDPGARGAGGSGHGLVGMRERVEALGGRLRTGASGDDFVVEATLPRGAPR